MSDGTHRSRLKTVVLMRTPLRERGWIIRKTTTGSMRV